MIKQDDVQVASCFQLKPKKNISLEKDKKQKQVELWWNTQLQNMIFYSPIVFTLHNCYK